MVSLVDKEAMRVKQAAIAETLKVWRKSTLATRTTETLANAKKAAQDAVTAGKVCQIVLFTCKFFDIFWLIC